jgi:peroxiredoxin
MTVNRAATTDRPDTIGRLRVGARLPDFELSDHAANPRRLSQLGGDDPTVLHFYRGWWCPKEQAFFRRLRRLQDDAEVAYSRIISVSVDPPEVSAAFRAGLGARWTFLSSPGHDQPPPSPIRPCLRPIGQW